MKRSTISYATLGATSPFDFGRAGGPEGGAPDDQAASRAPRPWIPISIAAMGVALASLPLLFSYDWQGRFRPPAGDPVVRAAHILDTTGDLPRAAALLRREQTLARGQAPNVRVSGAVRTRGNQADRGRDAAYTVALTRFAARAGRADECISELRGELANPMRSRGRNRREFRLGVCLELAGRVAAADAAYSRSVALKGEVPVVYLRRGLLRERAGRLREANHDLRRALEVSPSYPPALLHAGLFALRRGRRAEAEALLEKLTRVRKPYAELLRDVMVGRLLLAEPGRD